ncbi:AMP-binding protein [Amycolatopsis acidiphila]|uniref:AMP-binding protein n=1 Tax=Amycolatopsis acidiphila TaxID=715473 RepID=A0A558AA32_9PSEU|nr:AMP-binding protein [Amycolatopsis acidiphila]TVT21118.1 AMP-binding protein [Amycolatopsis acidiphila]UIJ57201.1 AMP-binding protein [Amycolatopsis acidiphila]GHG52716.1 acyl-CoA synthetase [Amycolatopsis acidiphila]
MPTSRTEHCLGDIPRRNAVRYAEVPSYVADGRGVTHGELYGRASALAAALAKAGLRRQDRIALFGRNSIAFGEVLAAGQLSGIIVATVNFRLAAPEIGRILADANPRVLFVDAEYLPVIDLARAELDLGLIVCLDHTERTDVVRYEDFLSSTAGADLPFSARPEDIACLIYTSGTTGRPKGCILGQRELFHGAHLMNVEMRTGSDDRVLLTMPLFHIGAMAIGLGLHARGGTSVLHRQFDPVAVLDTVAGQDITVLHLAPTMLQALLREAAGRPGSLAGVRTVVYSAAPITAPVLQAAMTAMPGAGCLNLYGQTEVMTSGLPRELHRGEGAARERRLSSVGHPFPDNAVRIVGEDGTECPPGTPGEVTVASPAMFRGYWNDSAATAATLRDGWCHTGDVGVLDEEGLLHLVDRKKDVIISGGENIYSLEVEEALVTHPGVVQCAVVGIPDERWGEAVCAVVVPAEGAAIDVTDLREHVSARIARYKAPRSVVVVEELPVLPTGKVDKKALRQQFAARQETGA